MNNRLIEDIFISNFFIAKKWNSWKLNFWRKIPEIWENGATSAKILLDTSLAAFGIIKHGFLLGLFKGCVSWHPFYVATPTTWVSDLKPLGPSVWNLLNLSSVS